jgi:NAD-dependent SIR2 family protein deacetylase
MERDIWGHPIQLHCMDCGKVIDRKREAPSGSFLPRCEKCNDKRWKQHYGSESEQLAKTSSGVNSHWDEYHSRYEDDDNWG